MKKISKILNDKIVIYTITIVLIISLIPIIILAIYSRPCVDDYSYSIETRKIVQQNKFNIPGIISQAIKTDIKFYNTWQGLYTSAFLLSLQPGIWGEQYYCIGMWILLLLIFICIYYFVKSVEEYLEINKYRFCLSISILGILVIELPSAIQGLYWFNGAWNYMPFLFMILLNISFLLQYFKKGKNKYIILSTILSFIISGGNHVSAFLNILILFLINIVMIRKRKTIILPLIFAIIGYIIVFMAPGTGIRQARLHKQGIYKTITMSLQANYDYLLKWINLKWLAMLILLTPLACFIKKEKKLQKENLKYNPLILIAISFILICGMLCVPLMALGGVGDLRVTNIIWLTFTFLTAFIWIYSLIWFSFRIKYKPKFPRFGLFVLCIPLLIIVLDKNSNTIKASQELINGNAKLYSQECDNRYKLMQETESDIIKVHRLPKDELLYFDDVTTDPQDWRNNGWKSYYGINIQIIE